MARGRREFPVCALIFQRALGLPSQAVSNSLLTGAGIAEVAAALRVAPGQILVDLAYGRGGYGREIARHGSQRQVHPPSTYRVCPVT